MFCMEYLCRETFRDTLFELMCVEDNEDKSTLEDMLDCESNVGSIIQNIRVSSLLKGEVRVARDRAKRDGVCLDLFLPSQLVHALVVRAQISLQSKRHVDSIESELLKHKRLKPYINKAVKTRRASRSNSWYPLTLRKDDKTFLNEILVSYLDTVMDDSDDEFSHGDAISLLYTLRCDVAYFKEGGFAEKSKVPKQSLVPRCDNVHFHFTPVFWNYIARKHKTCDIQIESPLDILKQDLRKKFVRRYGEVSSKMFVSILSFLLSYNITHDNTDFNWKRIRNRWT